MNSSHLRHWLEGIGIFAVVASFIFLGVQIHQEGKISSAQYAYDLFSAKKSELIGLIVDNKSLWIRGLNGELLSKDDAIAFEALAATYFGGPWGRRRLSGEPAPSHEYTARTLSGSESGVRVAAREPPLAANGENSRAKVQNVRGDSSVVSGSSRRLDQVARLNHQEAHILPLHLSDSDQQSRRSFQGGKRPRTLWIRSYAIQRARCARKLAAAKKQRCGACGLLF